MVSKFKQYNGADEYRGQSTDVKPQVIEANELRNELYCDSNEEGDNA